MSLKSLLTALSLAAVSVHSYGQTYTGTLSCGVSLSAAARPAFDSPAELIVKNGTARMKRSSERFEELLEGRVSGQQLSLEGQGKSFAGDLPWTTKLQGTIDGKTFKGRGEIITSKGEKYRECQVALVNTAKPIEQPVPIPAQAPVAQKPAEQVTKVPAPVAAPAPVAQKQTEQVAQAPTQTPETKKPTSDSPIVASAPVVVPAPALIETQVATVTAKLEEPKPTMPEPEAAKPKVEVPVAEAPEAKPLEKSKTTGFSLGNKQDLGLLALIAVTVLLTCLVVGFTIYWIWFKRPKPKLKAVTNRTPVEAARVAPKAVQNVDNLQAAIPKPENRTATASITSQALASATVTSDPSTTYQVKISGCRTNEAPEVVSQRLQALLKASPAQVDRLLSMPEYILKKALSEKQAQTYQAAIFKAGANCVIEEENNDPPLEADLPSSFQEQAKAAQVQQAVQPVVLRKAEKPQNPDQNLFDGDIALLLGKLNVKQGDAVITFEKLTYSGGAQLETVFKEDIQSVVETKHGLGKKVVLALTNGETVSFLPVNHKGFFEAMQVLTGEREISQLTAAPELSEVKNWSAWLAAFGPLIGSNLIVLIWGLPPYWTWLKTLVMIFNLIVVTFIFLSIDSRMLQKQGYSILGLGIPESHSPAYLFSRAKAFKQKPIYAYVWCGSLALAFYYFVA